MNVHARNSDGSIEVLAGARLYLIEPAKDGRHRVTVLAVFKAAPASGLYRWRPDLDAYTVSMGRTIAVGDYDDWQIRRVLLTAGVDVPLRAWYQG